MLEDLPVGWLIFGAIAIAAMVGSYYRRIKARAVRDRWVEAADELGFVLSGGTRSLFMSGAEGALASSVAVTTDDNETKTRYQVEFPPLGLGLRLTPQSGWQGFLTALGGQDVEIGDGTFDERFIVKASSPELAQRFFTSTRVAALNTLYDRHGAFALNNDELVLTVNGMADEVGMIVSTMNDVLSAARALQPEADLEPADRDEELQRVFETTAEGLPEAAEDIAAPVDEEPVPVSERPVAADSDALLVATRLFGDQQLGFETERLFTAEFEGRSIDWSGSVKRPAGLMATKEFDDDREVLVIEVARLDDDLYGSTAIDAIVAFPGGAAPQPGAVVRFTGRLIDVDGVSKDLYVADGRLS